MSSHSEHRSSSPKKDSQRQESRSRSRDRDRRQRNVDRGDRNRDRERDRDRDEKIKIKVPELTSPFCSFKHFCNLQEQRASSQSIQKGYDQYKKDWEQHQHSQFFKQYKNDPWFAERYDPEVLDVIQKEQKESCRKNYEEFIIKLNNGFYDKIDFTVTNPAFFGVVQTIEEQEQQSSSLNYILNHTLQINLNQNLDITKQPIFGFDQNLNTLFIKSVPRVISRFDIKTVVQKLQGFKCLTMSEPIKKLSFHRYCWIEFQDKESCAKAQLVLSGLMIKDESLVVCKSMNKNKRVKVLKNYPVARIEKDIKTLGKLIAKLDEETGIQKNLLLFKQFNNSHSKLDIFLLYLRKVHAYDYYTSTQYQNERTLATRVSCAFLRMQADYQELQNAQNIFKKIQEKAEERIQKVSQIKNYHGILKEQIQALIYETEKVDKNEQKDIWKCFSCEKKFKTCQFLAKHIIVKHEEIKQKKIQSIMEKWYLDDPQKISYITVGDRDQRFRRPFMMNHRRQKKREYRDFDDPDIQDKGKENTASGRHLVNFLDI